MASRLPSQSMALMCGWTLQEFLAPPKVVHFYSQDGRFFLGDKIMLAELIHEKSARFPSLPCAMHLLLNFRQPNDYGGRRNRDTKKKEDKTYCLLGIFDVSMSLRYGKGENTLVHLQKKIKKRFGRQSKKKKKKNQTTFTGSFLVLLTRCSPADDIICTDWIVLFVTHFILKTKPCVRS